MEQPRACSPINPNRIVATITGIQVVNSILVFKSCKY